MRILGSVILGLIGVFYVGGSSIDQSVVVAACKEELKKFNTEWKGMVQKHYDWTSERTIQEEEEFGGMEFRKLFDFLTHARESIEKICPPDLVYYALAKFESESIEAYELFGKIWDLRMQATIMNTAKSELSSAINMYTPIHEALGLCTRLEELRKMYQEEFRMSFEIFERNNYSELLRRAGLIDIGDSDETRMEKTLINALSTRTNEYLRLIRRSTNIQELEKIKNKVDRELKTQICEKYDQDLLQVGGRNTKNPSGDAIYQEFFDKEIKPAYKEKWSKLNSA